MGSPHQTSKIVRLGFVAKTYRLQEANRNTFMQRRLWGFWADEGLLQKRSFAQCY
jgi:hypothetical protein